MLKRSATGLLSQAAPDRPDLRQTALLERYTHAGDRLDGAAVAYFVKALSASGFLSVEEIPQVVADYSRRPAWRATLLAEAQQLCHVGLPVYASALGPLQGGIDWSNLPRGPHGDRLYQVRPHRFGFLPRLAMAAACGAETLPAVLSTLEDWIAQVSRHATATGAYHANLVVIYRLLAISWAAPFCAAMARDGNGVAAQICLRLFLILAADVQFLHNRLSGSVANNHLLADRFAAWFLATCHPELYPADDVQAAERNWQEELCRQFYADGTNFEQSVHYHEMGCELAVAYLVISLRRGKQPQEAILTRIRSMLRFQAAICDERGNTFALGDATDDPLLPLDASGGWGSGAWRLLYRALFDPAFPETGGHAKGAERAFWLLTALRGLGSRLEGPAVPTGGFAAFPDGGYLALRDGRQSQIIMFRTGPRHGVETYPGHAMADLLSVYWTIGGRPVMEPSGTYSYAALANQEGGPRRPRDYFRGPTASNGLVLDDHDPLGKPSGRFRGADNGTRLTTQWRFFDGVLSWAEGRLDEAGPLNGYRRGLLHVPGVSTVVYDCLPDMPPEVPVSCRWQFAPEAEVKMAAPQQALIELDGLSMFLCSSGEVPMDCQAGREDPPAGWVSRSYGRLQAAPQLIGTVRPRSRNLAFVFGMVGERQGLPEVVVLEAAEHSLLVEVKSGGRADIACFGDICVDIGVLPFDLRFQGLALWVGTVEKSGREIRALGLKRLYSAALGIDVAAESTGSQMPGTWRLKAQQAEIDGLSGRWEYSVAG